MQSGFFICCKDYSILHECLHGSHSIHCNMFFHRNHKRQDNRQGKYLNVHFSFFDHNNQAYRKTLL